MPLLYRKVPSSDSCHSFSQDLLQNQTQVLEPAEHAQSLYKLIHVAITGNSVQKQFVRGC